MSPKGRKALWRTSFVTAWSRPPVGVLLVWCVGGKGREEWREGGFWLFTDKDGGL